MKKHLFTYKSKHYYLKVNKRIKSDKVIIPIGCDCHPAYMLDKLSLRKYSLPFDWLDVNPVDAVQYAFENIRDKFDSFKKDLEVNSEGKVIARKYPYSLFYHYDDLVSNRELQEKIDKRIERLLNFVQSVPCYFLHNTSSLAFKTGEEVDFFINSVNKFIFLCKPKDKLLIYLRYDESFEENQLNCEKLLNHLSKIKQCKITRYIRNKNEFGIWGDESKYSNLVAELGVKRKLGFPKIELQTQFKT